jgi:hypothetical protein
MNGTSLYHQGSPVDAAPNLGPTEALAMQGRYLGMPR